MDAELTVAQLARVRCDLLAAADGLRLFAVAVGSETEAARWWRMREAVARASDDALLSAGDALRQAVVDGVRAARCVGSA